MNQDKLLILNYGGTQAQSLARKVRGDRVYCEILPADTPAAEISAPGVRGVILAGINETGFVEDGPQCDPAVFSLGLPVLAIGHGARCMARQLGGRVRHTALENQTLQIHFASSPLFSGLSYSDRFVNRLDMIDLPDGFTVAAHGRGMAAAFACEEKKLYGMQFGVESNDPDGLLILNRFAVDICGCEQWWTTENFVESAVAEIRGIVGEGHALMALSGGVDSSVCAMLMHRAIGDQMHCLYIDTGLMRKGDTRVVRELFGERMGIDIHLVNARDRFFARLEGLTDPAEKWRAVSDEFSIIYREEAARYAGVDFLVKGTIYPDVLFLAPDEQANLNELDGYRLIEPVRFLFKDEVRAVGDYLGLAQEITQRQPLPGSGLAARMTGEVTQEKLAILREADSIFRDEVEQAGLNRRLSRCCAQLSETTSTGEKRCRYVIALRALTQSGAAYSGYRMPYDLLERVTDRILTELPLVDRVVYDLTPAPSRSTEWENG